MSGADTLYKEKLKLSTGGTGRTNTAVNRGGLWKQMCPSLLKGWTYHSQNRFSFLLTGVILQSAVWLEGCKRYPLLSAFIKELQSQTFHQLYFKQHPYGSKLYLASWYTTHSFKLLWNFNNSRPRMYQMCSDGRMKVAMSFTCARSLMIAELNNYNMVVRSFQIPTSAFHPQVEIQMSLSHKRESSDSMERK